MSEAETTGRIRSIEKSNDLIGNQTRDLPVCGIVPQSTTLSRALNYIDSYLLMISVYSDIQNVPNCIQAVPLIVE
jgi:hypothetical protein